MSLVTYFQETLTCLHCGRAGVAWVWSKLGDRGATYKVGDCVEDDILPVDIEDLSLMVKAHDPGEQLHILHSWKCEHCGLSNFAEVVLDQGHVTAINAVELDSALLGRLHYISETVDDMLSAIIGGSIYNESGVRADWLTVLRQALDSGRRW